MKGFSLIEILLVIGVLSIIAVFTAPVAVDFYDRQVILSTSEEVYSALKKAQSFAEYRRNGSDHGVRFLTDDTYVLFQGPSYASRDSDYDEVYPLYGLSATTSPALSNTEIRFASGTGAIIATTTLSLSKNGITKKIYLCDSNVVEYDEICNAFDVASFDGTDDYVDMNDVLDFDTTDPLTITAWIKRDNTGTQHMIASKQRSSGNFDGYLFAIRSDDYLWFFLGPNTSSALSTRTTTTISADVWTHVAITKDTSTDTSGVNLYIDGVAQSKSDFADSLSGSTQTNVSFNIGARDDGNSYFEGEIANVAIYSDERTASEVLQDYENGHPEIGDDNLVSYWPLAGDYLDYASTTDGTQSGGVTFVEDPTRPDTGI